jgi:cupin fold WbuC family metalloprotein
MNSVLFSQDDIAVVDAATLQSLRVLAAAAPLRRSRLCLHRTSDDLIQEMVIAFAKDSYVRVHRHRHKSESFHVLEGVLQVVFFNDEGVETRRIRLGDSASGFPSLYRLSCDAWHTVLVETESVIIHETTNGPFVPGEAEFASWSPDGSQPAEVSAFLNRLGSTAATALLPNDREDPQRTTVPERLALPANARPVSSIRSDSSDQSPRPQPPRHEPTLTALICNYNHGPFVARAIEAMLAQSRPADEFIIVDDGSTDDSVEIIRSWVKRSPQIQFLQNERNLGFHASFQRAITTATSDFLYSGAADDQVLPGFFAGAMELAAKYPQTGVISGQFISVNPSGERLSTHGLSKIQTALFLDPGRYLQDVLNVEPATHSLSAATVFRRQPLIDVGGCRVELGSWGDTFSIQALGLLHGICYWPHPAMQWTILPGSLSQTTRSDPQKAMQIVQRGAALMRSEPFRSLFPEDYITRWTRGFRQAISHEQLHAAIAGHQALQQCCDDVARTAPPAFRLLLKMLAFSIKALYFVTFRVLRRVVTSQIAQAGATQIEAAQKT